MLILSWKTSKSSTHEDTLMSSEFIVVPYRVRGKGRISIAVNTIRSSGKSKKLNGYELIPSSTDNIKFIQPKLQNLGLSCIGVTNTSTIYDPVLKCNVTVLFVRCKYKATFNTDVHWIDQRTLKTKVLDKSKALLCRIDKILLSTKVSM